MQYSVDYADADGAVLVAGSDLTLPKARALARRLSLEHGAAYVLAIEERQPGQLVAVGHIPYHDGKADRPDVR